MYAISLYYYLIIISYSIKDLIQRISFSEPNPELKAELDKHNLEDLYQRFLKDRITQDNVWTLRSVDLDRMGLSLKEQIRYLSARETEEAKAGTDTNLLPKSLLLMITYSINLNVLYLFFRAKSETATRTRET